MSTILKFHLGSPTGHSLSGFLKITSGKNVVRLLPNEEVSPLPLEDENHLVFQLQPQPFPVVNYVWNDTLEFLPSDGWTEIDGIVVLDSDPDVKIYTDEDGYNEIGIVIVGTTELNENDVTLQQKTMGK